MKIISNFRDYYDSATAYGVDTTVVFQRTQNTVTLNTPWLDSLCYNRSGYLRRKNLVLGIQPVFFCGRVHPIVRLLDTVYFADFKSLVDFLATVKKSDTKMADIKDGLLAEPRDRVSSRRVFDMLYGEKVPEEPAKYIYGRKPGKTWRSYMEMLEETFCLYSDKLTSMYDAEIRALHLTYQTPILSASQSHGHFFGGPVELTVNPCLGDFKFGRIVDAYTAFQEVSMYLTNEMVSETMPDPSNVADKYMVGKKGFDPKYGFRTRP